MKFSRKQHVEPELNLVPLIDVLLMTLIFLVVTTSFSKEAQLRIKLPEASAEAKTEQALLRITIDAHGQFFVNDKQLLKPTADACDGCGATSWFYQSYLCDSTTSVAQEIGS